MKRIAFMTAMLLICILFFGCKGEISEPPEIKVTCDGTEIPYVVGLNKWGGSAYDREDTFHTIMKAKKDIPYIKQEKEIQIEFLGLMPDSTKLEDFVLDSNGNKKYNETVKPKTIPIKFSNKKGKFIISQNYASMFSSNSKDYEPGASIRGFRLNCKWGEDECEYAFIIRSDA